MKSNHPRIEQAILCLLVGTVIFLLVIIAILAGVH